MRHFGIVRFDPALKYLALCFDCRLHGPPYFPSVALYLIAFELDVILLKSALFILNISFAVTFCIFTLHFLSLSLSPIAITLIGELHSTNN